MLIFLWLTVLTWGTAMTTNGQRIYFILLLLLWGMWRHLCNEIYYLIIVDGDSQWWCGRFIYLKCCYNHVAVVWSHLPPLITIGQTWHTESNSERGYIRTKVDGIGKSESGYLQQTWNLYSLRTRTVWRVGGFAMVEMVTIVVNSLQQPKGMLEYRRRELACAMLNKWRG